MDSKMAELPFIIGRPESTDKIDLYVTSQKRRHFLAKPVEAFSVWYMSIASNKDNIPLPFTIKS